MMRQIAKAFSAIFIPLFIPTFSSLLIIWANPYAFGGYKSPLVITFLYFIILCTCILPGVGLFVMKKLNLVEDIKLKERQERIIPYFLIITCYSIAFYTLNNLPIPTIVRAMMFGSLFSIIISFFWNNFMKISEHANGMGSLLGLVIGLLFLTNRNIEMILIIVLLLSGAVLSSRLYLKPHTMKGIWYGYILGMVSQLGTLFIFLKIGL